MYKYDAYNPSSSFRLFLSFAFNTTALLHSAIVSSSTPLVCTYKSFGIYLCGCLSYRGSSSKKIIGVAYAFLMQNSRCKQTNENIYTDCASIFPPSALIPCPLSYPHFSLFSLIPFFFTFQDAHGAHNGSKRRVRQAGRVPGRLLFKVGDPPDGGVWGPRRGHTNRPPWVPPAKGRERFFGPYF